MLPSGAGIMMEPKRERPSHIDSECVRALYMYPDTTSSGAAMAAVTDEQNRV